MGDQTDTIGEAPMRLPFRPTSRRPTSRVDSGHGVADDSSEDNSSPKPERRGHSYRNVQVRENGRMHLGDNTYIAKQIVYSAEKRHADLDEDEKEVAIVDALAFAHMGTRLASISAAQDQTCRWLFDTSEYIQWRRGFWRSRHRILWIKGKPGSGKSTLMATAVQQASTDFKDSVVASFFFNARGDELGRTTEGMYRSLLHQIFSQLPGLPSEITPQVPHSLKRRGWELPMLQNLLRTTILHLAHEKSLVCYVDALDECAESEIRDALQHLGELTALAKSRKIEFLICFASRHYPKITVQYHRAINLDERAEHGRDISKYVKSNLLVPGSLGVELHDSLLDRSRHVFLWVVLTVKSLNELCDRGVTDSDLLYQLRDTPNKVEDLFRGLLENKNEYLLPILQWVLYAQQTLDVEELYFGVITSSGQLLTGTQDRTEIDRPRMLKFLTTNSRGLVEFWDEDAGIHSWRYGGQVSYAQLIHESLREYLFKSGLLELDPSMGSRVKAISHARLALWCVSYVAADAARYIGGPFHAFLTIRQFPLLQYITCNVVEHLQIAYADNVLPNSTLEQFATLWLTCKLDRFNRNAHADCAALLYFALVKHGGRYRTEDFGRFQAAYESRGIRSRGERWTGWHNASMRSLVLQAAVHIEPINLAQLFHDRDSSRDFWLLIEQALIQSAIEGSDHVLALLLPYVATAQTYLAGSLLRIAILHLNESTTMFLLQNGADLVWAGESILSSLARADDPSPCGDDPVGARLAIATVLLDNGADPKGAILSASRAGRSRLARLLAARGATISRSAVRRAREKGRRNILDIVEEAGVTLGDSTADSVDTSDASTTAVSGYQY